MTNQEAIETLKANYPDVRYVPCKHYPPESKWPFNYCDMRNTANRLELQELSKNSTELDKGNGESHLTCNQLATDCISRQAAIDALADMHCKSDEDGYVWIIRSDAWARIDALPSAQPEIIRCKECKYMIDTGDDLMCDNAKGWVVATTSDFGCVLAERRTDEE